MPGVVDDGRSRVVVARAWPDGVRDGIPRVTVEGRDEVGRLRAGTWQATGRTRLLPPGSDPRLPGLEGHASKGELVVHRAGKRAVIRLDGAYAKVVRPGRGPALAVASERGRRLAEASGMDAPLVLRADDGVVELSVVRGTPLHGLAGSDGWASAWDEWSRAWTRLQALPADPDLSVHTDADEAAVVRGWAADVVPAHRDLHDKQLLWDGQRLGVLDLDTACLAHPALHPANVAVHADLRRAQGGWSAAAAALVRDRAAEVAARHGVDPERWRLAQEATTARLVAVYAFRPRWRDTVLGWAEATWADRERTLIHLSSSSPARGAC